MNAEDYEVFVSLPTIPHSIDSSMHQSIAQESVFTHVAPRFLHAGAPVERSVEGLEATAATKASICAPRHKCAELPMQSELTR